MPTEEEGLTMGVAYGLYKMEADYETMGHQLEDMLLDCTFK